MSPNDGYSAAATPDGTWLEFLGRGEVRLPRCEDCGYVRPPASFACPECLGERTRWIASAGTGVVEGFTWYLQPFDPRFTEVPYNAALIRLDEGVRMIATVLDVAFGELAVGQRVRAEIRTGLRGRPVVDFRCEPPRAGDIR
ncbi:MAG: Zn-ribbon domain-containing OB-fold protein [Lautropia sp.]